MDRTQRERDGSPRARAERGFTLLESMISMVVVTIGLLGTFPMLSMASNRDSDGRRIDRAMSVAYGVLNHLQRLPFDSGELLDTHPANGSNLMDTAGAFAGAGPVTSAYDNVAITTNGGELVVAPSRSFDGYAPVGSGTARPSMDFNGDGKDDYRIFWIIKEELDPNDASLVQGKRISVIVGWRDPLSGRQRRTAVVGYRANVKAILP